MQRRSFLAALAAVFGLDIATNHTDSLQHLIGIDWASGADVPGGMILISNPTGPNWVKPLPHGFHNQHMLFMIEEAAGGFIVPSEYADQIVKELARHEEKLTPRHTPRATEDSR